MEEIRFSPESENDLIIPLTSMVAIWNELGVEADTLQEYKSSIISQFQGQFHRMKDEVKGHKKRVLDSLEKYTRIAYKLSEELDVSFCEPDPNLVLLRMEQAVRHDVKRMQGIKEERLKEVDILRKIDEDLCASLSMDPYYISTGIVPKTQKLNELKDHIETLKIELSKRRKEVETFRDEMSQLYSELQVEPRTEIELSVLCESLDRFVFSQKNIDQVKRIKEDLEIMLKDNQEKVFQCMEKIEALYERLQLDNMEKEQFLSQISGHSQTVIEKLEDEISRLEEIRRANIEKFIWNIRKELDLLWDKCYYSETQRNTFLPLHSTDYTEDVLKAHEDEVSRLKHYYNVHEDLFRLVSKWQEVWEKYQELERKAKDPSRLINARGNALLIEEKERKRVNNQLPKTENELHQRIREWETEHGTDFVVGGKNFEDYIKNEKEKYAQQLEAEKLAREQEKKKTLAKESRFGAKPCTPAKLKQSTMSNKTSSLKISSASIRSAQSLQSSRCKKTPGSTSRMIATPGTTSRILSRINTGLASLRSPRSTTSRSARITPGTANTSRAHTTLRQNGRQQQQDQQLRKKNRYSGKIKKNKAAMTRNVLSELDNSILPQGRLTSNLQDTVDFNVKEVLNSTTKHTKMKTPNYLTPTKAAMNKMFKTPTTTPRTTRGMSNLRSHSKSQIPNLI